jgi:formylmethanofuran dehydrogenase subunit E
MEDACYAPAVAICDGCHENVCEQHVVRMRARTLCQPCALVAAGVTGGRRRR